MEINVDQIIVWALAAIAALIMMVAVLVLLGMMPIWECGHHLVDYSCQGWPWR